MKKIALFTVTLLLLAGTGLAQRTSMQTVELTTTNPDHALYLKATAYKNIFTAKFSKMTFEAFALQVWVDKAGLIPPDDPAIDDPITLKVLVDTVSGERNIEIGQIVMAGDDPTTLEDESGCTAFFNYWSRPDVGLAGPAPSKIKTVRLVQNGEPVAEGSF